MADEENEILGFKGFAKVMTGTSARSDKSEKKKNSSVKDDEFASSSQARNTMFGEEETVTVQHEILKEKHEILEKNYRSLQERIKQGKKTYEIMKKHLQSRTEELEVTNKRLLEDCERERSEKTKLIEEMKTMESQRKATNDELMMKNQELEIIKNKNDELAEKFGVVEKECSYLKSLYDADEVVASGISVPETEQTKKRSGEDNTKQVGGSMASKRQKKDEPLVDDKDASADPYRDFRLLKGFKMAELFDEWERGMTHSLVKNTILLYDRDLKAAQKSVKELSKKNEALQAENVQFKTELIESKDNVVALEAEKARLTAKLDSETKSIEECILKESEKVRTEMATELGQILLDSMRSRRLQYNGESDKSSHPA